MQIAISPGGPGGPRKPDMASAGAALAPTDAALGAGMMANPVIPARIRRLINVESGLNDGIATPFVSVALAGAATGGDEIPGIPEHRLIRRKISSADDAGSADERG